MSKERVSPLPAVAEPKEADPNAEPENWRQSLNSVLLWIGFIVIVGLVPFFFSYCILTATKQQFSLPEVLSHGELLILSSALVGETCYESILSLRKKKIDLSVVAWIWLACLLLLIGSIGVYVILATRDITILTALTKVIRESDPRSLAPDLTSLRTTEDQLDTNFITYYSIVIFTLALITGIYFRWIEK